MIQYLQEVVDQQPHGPIYVGMYICPSSVPVLPDYKEASCQNSNKWAIQKNEKAHSH